MEIHNRSNPIQAVTHALETMATTVVDLTDIFKLQILGNHADCAIRHESRMEKRALGVELRGKIRDSYNNLHIVLAQGANLLINTAVGGWSIFGNATQATITAVSNATQQGTQTVTSLLQNRDEAARGEKQSVHQVLKGDEDHTMQEISAKRSTQEQLFQQLQSARDKEGQLKGQINGG
ncbi:MAG: hypothetical protein Q8K75_00930 [Chlamydiales bacterium]|nr:hypothetical protein [Chlamydiales bacterium]